MPGIHYHQPPSSFKLTVGHRRRCLSAGKSERTGSAKPEQVTMTRNRPVDRGLSCIPLFGFEWLASSSPKYPHWQFRLSAIRSLNSSLYDSQYLDATQFRASHSSMHDYVIVRHSRAILRCQKMQGRNAVQYGQALVAKKPEPSAAQGLRDSKIPQACPAGFLCF